MIRTVKVEELERMGALPSAQRTLKTEVSIGVSGRHIHLSREHLEKLFGKGYKLTPTRDLSQPGQSACAERVTLRTEKGKIENIRVLGPTRGETQIELSLTDTYRLKLDAPVPVRLSGQTSETPGLIMVGPAGEVAIDRGVIIAQRHIHMTPQDAEEFGVVDKQVVAVACGTDRAVIFGNVVVRVHESFKLDFHIDTDEANAAGVKTGDKGWVLRPTLAYHVPVSDLLR